MDLWSWLVARPRRRKCAACLSERVCERCGYQMDRMVWRCPRCLEPVSAHCPSKECASGKG